MKCPTCGLFNPDTALRCDCGYDFASKQMKRSYLHDMAPEKRPATPVPLRPDGLVREIPAQILNQSIGDEWWLRANNPFPGNSLFRPATLRVFGERLELGYTDDFTMYHKVAQLVLADITNIRIRERAVTPGQQLWKPVIRGAAFGLALAVGLWLRTLGAPDPVAPLIYVLLIIVPAMIFVVISLIKISTTDLAIVRLETPANAMEFAVETTELAIVRELVGAAGVVVAAAGEAGQSS